MPETFKATRISEHVWWVGAIDWSVRDFHGYKTGRGTTYNAYLVLADKPTLIDTVKAPFFGEMMARIGSVIDPADVQIIVSNHSEMDHSGCLPRTIQALRPRAVYASAMGQKTLEEHFHLGGGIETVADGRVIDLGGMGLTAVETRMLHWPDSMMTYLDADKVLFSQDGFGMHLATSQRFADEVDQDTLHYEAAKYYANILLPLSPIVKKALDKVAGLDLDIAIIAPDHGPVWRSDPGPIVELYAKWAGQEPAKKAVVTYDTMWGSTDIMARAIEDGLAEAGVPTRVMPLGGCHRSDIATEMLDAGALVVGSPTINNKMFPTVADLLTYIGGLKPLGRIGAAFGSHGWSGEGAKDVAKALSEMKVELVADPLSVKYVPDEAALGECRALGKRIAEELEARCK